MGSGVIATSKHISNYAPYEIESLFVQKDLNHCKLVTIVSATKNEATMRITQKMLAKFVFVLCLVYEISL